MAKSITIPRPTARDILYPHFCAGCKDQKLCNDNKAECVFFIKACDNLDRILKREFFFKDYRACEGDVRIVTSINGTYKRYTVMENGSVELKL